MARRYSWTKRLSWRLEYGGYLLIESVLRATPPALIDRAGSSLGFLLFHLSPKYRQLTIRNLRIAFGKEKPLSEIRLLARQTCQRTIANFLGALKTALLPPEEIPNHVTLLGLEPLRQALAEGKGAILVLGHMGNWEVLNRLHQHLPPGTPAGGIYQPLKNPLINQLLLQRREQDGSKLFSKKSGFHAPSTFVKEGGLLIVVADQKVGKQGEPCSFFGKSSSLSPLPALLARKAKAPVFAAGIETQRPGAWQVSLKALGMSPETGTTLSTLESLIRRSPADYLWLHDRWKLDNRTPLSMRCRMGKKPPLTTTPLRLLIVTKGTIDDEVITRYLAQRRPNDFPLQPEVLQLADLEGESRDASPKNSFQTTATTAEQLASVLRKLDCAKPFPIELAILLESSAAHAPIHRAAHLAHIPKVITNPSSLPLAELLQSLSIADLPLQP